MIKIFNLLLLLVLLFIGVVRAQEPDPAMRLRLAQSLEQSGDWERAIPVYETLLTADPQNYIYFDALRRGYTQLKQYQKAVDLIKRRLALLPGDPVLISFLGGVTYQMGDEASADSVWRSIVEANPKNPNMYRLVATQMMEYRLYDKAIQMFLASRSATGNQELFSEELANIYGAFQQYENATREYLRILVTRPGQLSYVQSRMSSYIARSEALRITLRVVQEEVKKNERLAPVRSLYAWLLVEGRDYEAALEEYRTIDKLLKTNGIEVFNFAQRGVQERIFPTAAKAFKEIMDSYPSSEMIPYARFGYARCLEEQSAGTETASAERLPDRPSGWPTPESQASGEAVIGLYESIVSDYPRTELACQACFRIGVMKRERLYDLDGAMASFERVRTIMPRHSLAIEASVQIAEILVVKNNLPRARQEYSSLLRTGPADVRDRVMFRIAELDYFSADFDSSLAKLKTLTVNPATDLANDALQLLYFIEENKLSRPALTEFAKADLLMRQERLAESLERFKELIQRQPQALFIDDAVLKTGELQLLLSHPAEAVQVFTSIVAGMPGSILRDRAQFRIGEVYERAYKDKAKAIEAYEYLLSKFPNSLFTEEARKRIRTLRGDAI